MLAGLSWAHGSSCSPSHRLLVGAQRSAPACPWYACLVPQRGWLGCSALFPVARCPLRSVQMRTAVANCPLSTGPSLKTLCKLAVIQYSLDQSCLPHDIRYCVPCREVTPRVLPVLGVLQPWLRAAWGPLQHCAASGWARLETTAEADVQRGCSSPGHCVRAFSQCILLVCYRWELSAMTTNSTISRPIVSSQG